MLGSSGWDKEIAAIARLADRPFLLPAIRKIIPRTPVIGRRINIHWLSDGRPANSVAFSGHALGINGVISHLQGAAGGIGIPCSNSTTCNQTGASAQRRTRSIFPDTEPIAAPAIAPRAVPTAAVPTAS